MNRDAAVPDEPCTVHAATREGVGLHSGHHRSEYPAKALGRVRTAVSNRGSCCAAAARCCCCQGCCSCSAGAAAAKAAAAAKKAAAAARRGRRGGARRQATGGRERRERLLWRQCACASSEQRARGKRGRELVEWTLCGKRSQGAPSHNQGERRDAAKKEGVAAAGRVRRGRRATGPAVGVRTCQAAAAQPTASEAA
jgi:hypothetical protein